MKKVLVVILKILGFVAYSILSIVIGAAFNSPMLVWILILGGIIFIIWRYSNNKQKKLSVSEDSVKNKPVGKEKFVDEKAKSSARESKSTLKKVKPNNNSNIKENDSNFNFLDLFKLKQFKLKIQELNEKNSILEKEKEKLEENNDDLKREADVKLSLKQLEPWKLDQKIKEKSKELEKLNQKKEQKIQECEDEINNKEKEIDQKNTKISQLESKINDLEKNLVDISDQAMYEDYGLYKPRYDFSNSSTFKGKLSEVRANQKQMLRDGTAGEIFRPMLLDNSQYRGRSMQKKNIKQLVRSFNGECEAAINKVTKNNIEIIEKRINRSFDQLNKLNGPNGVRLTPQYLDSKLDEAHIALEYALKKEEERELLREQREREKEERQAQKEIARERQKYEKDETHFQQVKDLLQEKIANSKSSVEIESLKTKLLELQKKLDDIKEKKIKLSNHAENPTAGYVYIISNIGSFGQKVYKIGVTRRLNPIDRINELSSASVPFKFDVHALIFTDDAYKLETELHNYFDKKRVNKVNMRKEFFRLDLDEIKKVLKKHKELTFDFKEVPDAPEYRDTLLIEKQQKQALNV